MTIYIVTMQTKFIETLDLDSILTSGVKIYLEESEALSVAEEYGSKAVAFPMQVIGQPRVVTGE